MLTSPLCFVPPWHSKQYFWKVCGRLEGRRGGGDGAAPARRGAGAWAAIMDAPGEHERTAKPPACHRTTGRF